MRRQRGDRKERIKVTAKSAKDSAVLTVVKEMSGFSSSKDAFAKKRKEARARFESFRQAIEKKKKVINRDLEESTRMWEELGKKFPWWGALP